MPSIHLYIKEKTWANLLRAVRHDRRAAIAKIRELLEAQYG